ncbi:MAG TPA: pyridoxamine 5'-phosphate oxidase family protein [Opitutaceae bacterium]|jgi:hypothetical protein
MRRKFLNLLETPPVREAQAAAYGVAPVRPPLGDLVPLTEDERAFIEARDSFYLASISESGWPYIQHRGGPRGFLRALDDRHLAFADYSGNLQLISTGNVSTDARVCLFLMDYPARERLKILALARVLPADDPRLADLAKPPGTKVERGFLLEVQGYDWNCPKYITPRFTAAEVELLATGLRERIREREDEINQLRPGKIR